MRLANTVTAMLVSASLIFFTSGDALAKDNKPKKSKAGSGASIQIQDKPGNGPKAVPPGQIKRYTRGAKLPADLRFTEIKDLSKWKLKAPGKGNRYIRIDNDILEVTDDFSTVVDAIGIVGDLAK
ncbi:hypothetical protein [Shimia sediminis]|uniref:hypothetical protein n=1 Tax=Shimia sediminis TaxID=2497945 RepID=UPI000F8D8EBE|nr:hypothetical protein [Shimia sediminis]